MDHPKLKNKPLVEAMIEVRWQLQQSSFGGTLDPHYNLLLGRLFDRLNKDYPAYEATPMANIPENMAGQTAQHRFRAGPNAWPVVQVGPGVVTLNSTAEYVWEDFRPRAVTLLEKLFESHPSPSELRIESLTLRYIDAVPFDYSKENAIDFLKAKMNVGISLPPGVFTGQQIDQRPENILLQSTFRCEKPKGAIRAGFATGQREKAPALFWETQVQSIGPELPPIPAQFQNWIDDAHTVTGHWFFQLISGDLQRSFE
ncbi:MAG: TIGR04255 family protein [Phycisphaerae bacterium]